MRLDVLFYGMSLDRGVSIKKGFWVILKFRGWGGAEELVEGFEKE